MRATSLRSTFYSPWVDAKLENSLTRSEIQAWCSCLSPASKLCALSQTHVTVLDADVFTALQTCLFLWLAFLSLFSGYLVIIQRCKVMSKSTSNPHLERLHHRLGVWSRLQLYRYGFFLGSLFPLWWVGSLVTHCIVLAVESAALTKGRTMYYLYGVRVCCCSSFSWSLWSAYSYLTCLCVYDVTFFCA